MNVGDLVKWTADIKCDYGGLGTIVETNYDLARGWRYRIMWHVDIKDAVDHKGTWYRNDVFYSDCIVKV